MGIHCSPRSRGLGELCRMNGEGGFGGCAECECWSEKGY